MEINSVLDSIAGKTIGDATAAVPLDHVNLFVARQPLINGSLPWSPFWR